MYKLNSPFSEAFNETWEIWKKFLLESWHFRYVSPINEQAALNELVDLCEGDEEHAKRIVTRSISRNWKGLYKVHNPAKDKKDGEAGKKKTTGRTTSDDLKAVFVKRTGTEG